MKKKYIIKYTLMKTFCTKLGYFKLKIIGRFKKLNRGNLFRIPRFLYIQIYFYLFKFLLGNFAADYPISLWNFQQLKKFAISIAT